MTAGTIDEIGTNRIVRVRSEARRPHDKPNPVCDRCAGGNTLVDIGCGSGRFLREMHDRYDTLVGVDFIPLVRPEQGNVDFARADLRKGVPIADDVADTVTAIEVIEHMSDPILLANEAFRITRPGGEFILTTPNIRYVRHLFRLVVKGQGPKTSGLDDDQLLWDGGHVHYFTAGDLEALLRMAGFGSVRSIAMIESEGFLPVLRRLLSRRPGNPVVREFLTGRLLVRGTKPGERPPHAGSILGEAS